MIEKMRDLQIKAWKACERRGHNMTAFISYDDTNAVSSCYDCHMEVQCLTDPMPNQIDIGGEAVALNCPYEKEK